MIQIHSPGFSVRENIETQLFAIAKEHVDLASKDIDRNDVEKRRKEMKHSIIAIVMCYTTLEALSNTLYNRLTQHDFSSKEFKKFDNRELNSRWKYLTNTAYQYTNNTNDKRGLPRKRTNDLKYIQDLRHKIIHYTSTSENPETLRKFPDNSPIYPEFELFTHEEAKKALGTVRTLLKAFEKITGYKVPNIE